MTTSAIDPIFLHVDRCRSCDAAIIWAISAVSGKRMPLDPFPVTDGNIALFGQSRRHRDSCLAVVLTQRQLDDASKHGVVQLYRSHFASCPDAAHWRRAPTPPPEGALT